MPAYCLRCGDPRAIGAQLCDGCHAAGWRAHQGGYLYQLERYTVHTWNLEARKWDPAQPVEAADPRAAYLAARALYPGRTVHVARVLVEPCSPGERAHA